MNKYKLYDVVSIDFNKADNNSDVVEFLNLNSNIKYFVITIISDNIIRINPIIIKKMDDIYINDNEKDSNSYFISSVFFMVKYDYLIKEKIEFKNKKKFLEYIARNKIFKIKFEDSKFDFLKQIIKNDIDSLFLKIYNEIKVIYDYNGENRSLYLTEILSVKNILMEFFLRIIESNFSGKHFYDYINKFRNELYDSFLEDLEKYSVLNCNVEKIDEIIYEYHQEKDIKLEELSKYNIIMELLDPNRNSTFEEFAIFLIKHYCDYLDSWFLSQKFTDTFVRKITQILLDTYCDIKYMNAC